MILQYSGHLWCIVNDLQAVESCCVVEDPVDMPHCRIDLSEEIPRRGRREAVYDPKVCYRHGYF